MRCLVDIGYLANPLWLQNDINSLRFKAHEYKCCNFLVISFLVYKKSTRWCHSAMQDLNRILGHFNIKFKDTGHFPGFGNCHRPVFSLGVSQHMHKITNLWKFELNLLSKLRDNSGRKNTLVTLGTSKSNSEVSKSNSNILVENNFVSQKLRCFRGSRFSHCLYHQLLPITK